MKLRLICLLVLIDISRNSPDFRRGKDLSSSCSPSPLKVESVTHTAGTSHHSDGDAAHPCLPLHLPCTLRSAPASPTGARGGGDENETSRQIKTQLMTEMQGVGDNMKGILVLAATNCPYSLDAAFRRRCAHPPPRALCAGPLFAP